MALTTPRVRRTSQATPKPIDTPLSLRADLIHPPLSQVACYEQLVSERVSQLDLHAAMLGQAFGISLTTFILNPLSGPTDTSSLGMASAILEGFAHREERVSLERKSGRWGLYFTRAPAIISNDRRSDSVPLKDAPLDVRERFLQKSEEFFRSYLAMCEDRLSQMKQAVSDGDRTLKLLANIQLD